MPKPIADFSKETAPQYDDGRLDAPAFHRNRIPILDVVTRFLKDRSGDVIEIGAGTGQHTVEFAKALSNLTWWPSDPNPNHRESIRAWSQQAGLENVRLPIPLDAAELDWALAKDGRPPEGNIAAIVCINVLHIAPWAVAEGLVRGASRYLSKDGTLLIYGPYKKNGIHISASNEEFDAVLRARNPAWGVRDTQSIGDLVAIHNLRLAEIVPMPANNLTLILTRA